MGVKICIIQDQQIHISVATNWHNVVQQMVLKGWEVELSTFTYILKLPLLEKITYCLNLSFFAFLQFLTLAVIFLIQFHNAYLSHSRVLFNGTDNKEKHGHKLQII